MILKTLQIVMKKILVLIGIIFIILHEANAQGCVAIRSNGAVCSMDHADSVVSKWQFSANNRYFKSFRHFVGYEEQLQRVELGTEVINHNYSLDLTLFHHLTNRWSVMVNVPIIYNDRSSLYEHGGLQRYHTSSYGIGDARVAVYKWLLNPVKNHNMNIQAGLGLKLPTGDYRYTDRFYTATPGVTRFGPVDQSIQLGDGGLGITTELNAYYMFRNGWGLYGNFYYLINPREQNGVSTARGGVPSANQLIGGSDVMSVPDQFMLRLGLNYMVGKFTFQGGVRREAIPVNDLIGGSNGFRRPGFIVSAEPGIVFTQKKTSIFAYVPIAVTRNRTQSVPDKLVSAANNKYTQGDAAFADYVVNLGLSIKF